MKFRLYNTESEWNACHASVMEALGIPSEDGNTTTYAEISQVDNESPAAYGKFIMPVMSSGGWKCDQLFTSGLVDLDTDWINT